MIFTLKADSISGACVMIYVFLRNKLISCDSILPVALEIHERYGQAFTFFTFDRRTHEQLEKNVVINDCIEKMGGLNYFGPVTKYRFLDVPFRGFKALWILLQLKIRKSYIFHFGQLSQGKLKFLTKCVNEKSLFLFEADASGYSQKVADVEYASSGRIYNIKNLVAPDRGSLVAFSDAWLWLNDERVASLNKYKILHPRKRRVWQSYIDRVFPFYTQNLTLNDKVVVIILGYFGPFGMVKDEKSVEKCLSETLQTLCCFEQNITVLMKPHHITDMEKLDEICKKFIDLDIQISYLHPSVLARLADVFICNCYSTAVYDASIQGVPVVEYTEYCREGLDVSRGASCRPEYVDYFIQRDADRLKKVLGMCLTGVKSEHLNEGCSQYDSSSEFFVNFSDGHQI